MSEAASARKWLVRIFGQRGSERRIGAYAAAILTLTVLITGGVIAAVLGQQIRADLENALVRSLNDRTALFQHEIDATTETVHGLAGRAPLARLLARFEANQADHSLRREIGEQLEHARQELGLSALALHDVRGELVAMNGAFSEAPLAVSLRHPENASLFWRDGFHLHVAATMRLDGAVVGVVRAENALVAMSRAYRDYQGCGETGEIALCGALPGARMRCFPTRHHPQIFDIPRSIKGRELPLSLALDGKSGVNVTLDYRGQEVFDAFRPVGGSGLGVVMKIDTAELRESMLGHLWWIIPFIGALLIFGFALLRWQMAPLVRQMSDARKRVNGILDNSADGIITIDEQSTIESFNFAAGRLFGYAAFEVIGQHVSMLMPEQYRGKHEHGIRNYLRSGEARLIGHGPVEVQGLRKDGSIFPMELSLGEMVLGDRRLFIGSIRDISALKQAHEELKSGFAALQTASGELEKTHAQLRQAELDKDRQMNALADANVRMALYHATLENMRGADAKLVSSGDQDAFYRTVLHDIMALTGAKYGAVGIFDASGGLRQFLTDGLSEEARQKIGPCPAGKGLLQAFYRENAITRVARIADDPRSCGFPPGHPPMCSLLGAPLNVNGKTRGVIYLTDKDGGEPFTDQDEMLVEMLAREVEHILGRGELLVSLRDSNQALNEEKAEQQILIGKLQEAQAQLLQSEKMASIGQLAAGVAHEINNPIGYVHSNLGSLEQYGQSLFALLAAYEKEEGAIADSAALGRIQAAKQAADLEFLREDVAALMSESREGITRVKKIVQDLKDFSHVDETEWQWADLHKGLDSTLNIVWNELKYKAEVVKEYGVLPEVECIPAQLNQVFMNLLVNAGHAIETRGTITMRTGAREDQVWVEITDSGKGIEPEHLKRIFDPFFTTKPVGSGTGLGLSVSYNIIQKHHGRIEVESEPGKGTLFRVWLPVCQPARG